MPLCKLNSNLPSANLNKRNSNFRKANKRKIKSISERRRTTYAKAQDINKFKEISLNFEKLLPYSSPSDKEILNDHARDKKEVNNLNTNLERSVKLINRNTHNVIDKISQLAIDKSNTGEKEKCMESEKVNFKLKQFKTIEIEKVTENKDNYVESDSNKLHKVSILGRDCVLLNSKQSCDTKNEVNGPAKLNSTLNENKLADTMPIMELMDPDSIITRQDALESNLTSTPKNKIHLINENNIDVSGIGACFLTPNRFADHNHNQQRNVKIGELRGNISAYENKSNDNWKLSQSEKYSVFKFPEKFIEIHSTDMNFVNRETSKFPNSPNISALNDLKSSRRIKRKKTINKGIITEIPDKKRSLMSSINAKTEQIPLFARPDINDPSCILAKRQCDNYRIVSSKVKMYLLKYCPNCIFLEMDKQWSNMQPKSF